ncbi:MAG: hypothetical protein WD876_02260 [Candidatus Pacearchaeota archaeon]
MRDKSHMEAVERWAEFVKNNPREEWKKAINILINATYEKADEFYKKLEETEKGREILRRLEEERLAKNLVVK